MTLTALHAALHAALSAALAAANGGAAVPVTSTPTAALPYVVLSSETLGADPLLGDKRARAESATKTLRVYAESEHDARAYAGLCLAALFDEADLRPRLAAESVRLVAVSDPFVTTGPDNAPGARPPLGSFVVRARYTLSPA